MIKSPRRILRFTYTKDLIDVSFKEVDGKNTNRIFEHSSFHRVWIKEIFVAHVQLGSVWEIHGARTSGGRRFYHLPNLKWPFHFQSFVVRLRKQASFNGTFQWQGDDKIGALQMSLRRGFPILIQLHMGTKISFYPSAMK